MNHRGPRWLFGSCVVASLGIIAAALRLWGAAEIRASWAVVFFLTFVGALWLLLATDFFSWLGLSFHDDAIERANVPALIALCGAVIAVAIIYAGGSIGEGPSYGNNVFSAGLGTAALFALWVLLELGAKVSVSIAEDRDLASGLRLSGLLMGTGLILGRSVAGDWHSASATVQDSIRDGWLAASLVLVALVIERLVRPTRQRPVPPWPSRGLLPALLYLAIAGAWVWYLGAWEGMPK